MTVWLKTAADQQFTNNLPHGFAKHNGIADL
jgi:hypothetical protein